MGQESVSFDRLLVPKFIRSLVNHFVKCWIILNTVDIEQPPLDISHAVSRFRVPGACHQLYDKSMVRQLLRNFSVALLIANVVNGREKGPVEPMRNGSIVKTFVYFRTGIPLH